MKQFPLMVMALFIAACAQFGIGQTDTFNKRIAAAYVLVQTVADSATAAVQSGKLKPADAQNVVTTGKAALAGIDVAKSVYAEACPAVGTATCTAPAADAKLTATLTVLQALQSYLATQGVK
jgi:hypothetical protein